MALSRTPSTEIKHTVTPFTPANEVREWSGRQIPQFKKTLKQSGFRMGKTNKKPIGRSVVWLFLHITPPYLSPQEISKHECTRDEFYISRCYQDLARLLHIKMKRGWQRGKKRDKLNDNRLPAYFGEIGHLFGMKTAGCQGKSATPI